MGKAPVSDGLEKLNECNCLHYLQKKCAPWHYCMVNVKHSVKSKKEMCTLALLYDECKTLG